MGRVVAQRVIHRNYQSKEFGMSKVVHCKRDRYDVYIGRPSEWGNPFKIGADGSREEVIQSYRAWLHGRMQADPALKAKVATLHGKTLGCWCSPAACHGDVLLAAAAWAAGEDDPPPSPNEEVGDVDRIVAGYEALEAAQNAAAKVRREKELVDAFYAAVDRWAAKPVRKTLSAGYECDFCESLSEHRTEDGAEMCSACLNAAVTAARAAKPKVEARRKCICSRPRRYVNRAGVEVIAPSFPMQVYYTDRYNENLAGEVINEDGTTTPGEEPREIPDWVRLEAMQVELACPATHHLTEVLTTEWYGNDVVTSEDEGRLAMQAREEELAQLRESHRDFDRDRWAGEFESYDSQHAFIEELTIQKRNMLFRLLRAVGANPSAPETVQWIKDVVEDTTVVKNKRGVVVKNGAHGNRLRGYSRCLWLLQQRIEDGTLTIK